LPLPRLQARFVGRPGEAESDAMRRLRVIRSERRITERALLIRIALP
jgi:hypothetical protein